jgi:predicted esterase
MSDHPHGTQSVARRGALLNNAQATVIIIHGRGGTNHQALSLVDHLELPGFAYLAPQAANYTWYPQRFIAPTAHNQPGIASGLRVIDDLIEEAVSAGVATDHIALLGFSQGACLAAEYAARNPRRLGGVFVLSGGLIGTDEELTGYDGSLDATPVFLGCSDIDSHIPVARVHQSAEIFETLGATVEKRIYPGMGHTINQDELDFVHQQLHALA